MKTPNPVDGVEKSTASRRGAEPGVTVVVVEVAENAGRDGERTISEPARTAPTTTAPMEEEIRGHLELANASLASRPMLNETPRMKLTSFSSSIPRRLDDRGVSRNVAVEYRLTAGALAVLTPGPAAGPTLTVL